MDARPEPGLNRRADLVFRGSRVAVFIDGCFWHSCPEHGTVPAANAAWWKAKLDRTVERDRETDRRLEELGWTVIRVWEHDDPDHVAEAIEAAVRDAVPMSREVR